MNYDDPITNPITASEFLFPKLHNDTENMPKTQFEWVKYEAVRQLSVEMLNKMEIIKNSQQCLDQRFKNEESLPNKLFGWSFENFVERRSLSVISFAKMLLSVRNHCIEEKKFIIDMNELMKFTKLIFQCYVHQIDEQYFDLKSFLSDAEATVTIHETMSDLFQQNKIDSQSWQDSLAVIETVERLSKMLTETSKDILIDINTDEIIYNRLEGFHISKYYEREPVAKSIESERSLNSMNSEIEKLKARIDRENICFWTIMETIGNETEILKNRIKMRSRLYDIEYEKVLNKDLYLKSQMEKIQSFRQYYKEQLKRFREELEEMRLRDIRREQQLKAEKLAKQEADRLEALKKKRKRNRSKSKTTKSISKPKKV